MWYAAYGSNLSASRFGCYLAGGRPHASAARVYPGARDPASPRATRAVELPRRLYFAGASQVWGGATAFLDHAPGVTPTRARAYLVTWDQFEDLVAQESHRPTAPVPLADADLQEGLVAAVGPGRYETLLCVGRHEGVPVVTFTAPWSLAEVVPAAPAPGYLAMLIAGLRELHQMADAELRRYLVVAPGCLPGLVDEALAQLAAGERGVGGPVVWAPPPLAMTPPGHDPPPDPRRPGSPAQRRPT